MIGEKIISREYKLVLKTENFTGDESVLIKKAGIFWASFVKAVSPVIKITSGNLDTIDTHREIMFYDTKKRMLHKENYIFRERKDLADDSREVTLKFRHPDRYVSQDRDMQSKTVEGKIKFEEDIKAPFTILYSYSSTQPVPAKKEFTRLKQVAKLYPGLAEESGTFNQEEEIVLINDRIVTEVVITGASLTLSDEPLTEAECALIAWYDAKDPDINPLIVEFSFRYGNKKGKYSKAAAQNAYDLFTLIGEEMKEWIDSEGATKTGFIFDHSKSH